MNDPDYYNSRLRGIADQVRENISRREQTKDARRVAFGKPAEDAANEIPQDEIDLEFEDDFFREKYTKSNQATGKPPKARRLPVYNFQKQFMPIRNRVQQQKVKSVSF